MNDEDFINYLGGFFDADGSVYWSGSTICINFFKNVQNSREYKEAISLTIKRVYNKSKTDVWRESIKSSNRKKTIDDDKLMQIMKLKLNKESAECVGKLFNTSRSTIQNIWVGKQKPSQDSEEYIELLNFSRCNLNR